MVHDCEQGVLDDAKYNDPVPLIGLYVAGSTFVCLALMASDMYAAYRTRKRWLPCRLFSLNSMSLTLLSVVAKLPIDLTSAMPSVQDQLSKLTSMAFICISIGFFMPSIGNNKESDSMENMIGLSIFVLTVIINVSMQLYTGVIFLFPVGHIIIMCCMLGLLIMSWFLTMAVRYQRRVFMENQKDLIQKGGQSMLERLKVCYLHGFNSNPQLVLCKDPHSATCGFLCLISTVVMVEATCRSLLSDKQKFCKWVSSYGFSMWMIVIIQIVSVLTGSSATSFRWLSMVTKMQENQQIRSQQKEKYYSNPILGIVVRDVRDYICDKSLQMGDFIMFIVVLVPAKALDRVFRAFHLIWSKSYEKRRVNEEFKEINYRDMGLDDWTFWKSVTKMKRWMDSSKAESMNSLFQLLYRTPPSQQLYTLELKNQVYLQQGIEVSILSMVLLLRVAVVSMPPTLSAGLVKPFKEAYEILFFINDRTNFASLTNKKKSKLAKLVWRGRDFRVVLPFIYGRGDTHRTEPESEFDRALLILQELKTALPSDVVWDEVGIITDFINHRSYTSISDIYNYIEQLLVDMLHLFFSQLPIVIYNEVAGSPPEEFGDRVRLALKIMWKIEPLESLVQWSFPVGSNISSLITPKVPATENQNDSPEEVYISANSYIDHDVIIPVE